MRRRLLPLLALLAAGLLVVAPPAAAQTGCDELVFDETGELDVAELEAAAEDLRSLGPEPRIRAVEDAGGNADLWASDEAERCTSWQGPEGGFRTNLVVVMVSLDRQSGVFFGDQWADELTEPQPEIRSSMSPFFQDGDFTGGLLAGIDGVTEAITDPAPVAAPSDGGGDDGGSNAGLAWAVVGLAGVAAAGFGGNEVVKRRRRRRDSELAAEEAEGQVSARFLDLQERWDVSSIRAEALLDDAADDEYPGLQLRLAELASGLGRVGVGMTDAPVGTGSSVEETTARAEHYTELASILDDVERLFDDLDAVVDAEHTEKGTLLGLLEGRGARMAALDADIDTAEADGWIVGPARAQADRIAELFDSSAALVTERRFDSAEAPANEADALLVSAHRWLVSRPELAAQSRTDHAELIAHRSDLTNDLDHADRVLTDLTAEHPRRAFADHADLKEWGARELARFDSLLVEADTSAAGDEQRFEDALERLAEAQRVAGSIAGRVAALDRLDHELREAERAAPEALTSATTSARAARRFVAEHADELLDWDERLAAVAADLDAATAEAERDRPDWLVVVRRSEAAQLAADAVRHDAAQELTAVREARRELAELEVDLGARADALARYVDRNHGDVRSGVDAIAQTTRAALDDRSDQSPVERLERLRAVEETLGRAEEDANADVAAAQRRRQRRGGVILVGGGWPGGFSGGGFGGGGGGGGFGGFGGGGFGGGFGGGGMGGGGGSW
ncbi:MAG: hypothetical protein AAFZ07_07545 [Actinomycetota bacterium]